MDSSSTQTHANQAGPLPSKAGEIGYQAELHGTVQSTPSSDIPVVTPLSRHPADRDVESVPTVEAGSTTSQVTTQPKKAAKGVLFGVRTTSLFIFVTQILFFLGTIAGWVLATRYLSANQKTDQDTPPLVANTTLIFVHGAFAIATIGQLIFLERRLYWIRAQRYCYLHPGQVLPTHRGQTGSSGSTNLGLAFAPWNRPPLPTYANALAQSGYGTGDVEDNVIAIPPPPAYGNTKSTKLVLQGHLRDSQRIARPVSITSQTSVPADRPASYVSHDEQWEEVLNAARARDVEEALSRDIARSNEL